MLIAAGRLIFIIMKVTSAQDVASPDINFHRDDRKEKRERGADDDDSEVDGVHCRGITKVAML